MNKPDKWYLHLGCHRGTVMSRDSEVTELNSLDECREMVARMHITWAKCGYYIWFAYAMSPQGQRTELHKGVPYF